MLLCYDRIAEQGVWYSVTTGLLSRVVLLCYDRIVEHCYRITTRLVEQPVHCCDVADQQGGGRALSSAHEVQRLPERRGPVLWLVLSGKEASAWL